MSLFHVEKKSVMGNDTKYSRAITVPQYIPSDNMPPIESLVDTKKYIELIRRINQSNVDDAQKKFLRLAAARHLEFNYARIADYYANAAPEMQELMEQSALIILDIDDAIRNGYVKLSQRMEELVADAKSKRLADRRRRLDDD